MDFVSGDLWLGMGNTRILSATLFSLVNFGLQALTGKLPVLSRLALCGFAA